MKIEMEYLNNILFIRFIGSLNKRNIYKINNYLIPVIKKHNILNLVCNLNELRDIDIAGMESLLNLKCIIKLNKGKMYFCGLHKRIEEYLKPLKIKHIDNEFLAVELLGA